MGHDGDASRALEHANDVVDLRVQRGHGREAVSVRGLAVARLAQELRDPHRPLGRMVGDERELGHVAQVSARTKLVAEEGLRVRERRHGALAGLGVPEHADVDPRATQVGRDLDRGHRRERDARVPQLLADEHSELAL